MFLSKKMIPRLWILTKSLETTMIPYIFRRMQSPAPDSGRCRNYWKSRAECHSDTLGEPATADSEYRESAENLQRQTDSALNGENVLLGETLGNMQ